MPLKEAVHEQLVLNKDVYRLFYTDEGWADVLSGRVAQHGYFVDEPRLQVCFCGMSWEAEQIRMVKDVANVVHQSDLFATTHLSPSCINLSINRLSFTITAPKLLFADPLALCATKLAALPLNAVPQAMADLLQRPIVIVRRAGGPDHILSPPVVVGDALKVMYTQEVGLGLCTEGSMLAL